MNVHVPPQDGNPPPRSALHQAALDYVNRGRRIIPIVPGGKTPMLKKWHDNAFTTSEQVDAHWTEHPESNIAFCPDDLGLAIIDCDPGSDVAPLNLPATYEVQTPRKGKHLYFVGTVPPTAGKLGRAIDTRGHSSYVLIPPSIVNGKKYKVKADRAIAALPAEIEAKLASRADAGASNVHDLDLPTNVERAQQRLRDLVKAGTVAVQGRGGDDFTFKVACELVRDLGLSEAKSLELMQCEFNPHCIPPWSPEELEAKITHAAAYGQNEAGTYAVQPASEVFKDMPLAEPAKQEPQPKKLLRVIPFTELAERKVKPVEEVISGLIEKGVATMLSGPGGTHKSRYAQQLGLSIQAGLPVLSRPVLQSRFIYLDYENGENEVARRTQKMRDRLNLPSMTAADYFDFKTPHVAATGPVPPYEAAPVLATVTDENITPGPLYYELYDYLRSISGHKFVVLDSCYNVLRFVGQAKINETAVKAALNLLDYFCAATNSTMLYLWHPSQAGQERGDASGWSVAWQNTPRARLSISKVEEAKDAFSLKVEKRNNGPAGETVTLHWNDGVLLPIANMSGNGKGLLDACVELALQAAKNGNPLQLQRKIAPAQLSHLERELGFKPSNRDVKDQLQQALLDKKLRYVKGHGKTMAGYYPYTLDPIMAATYAEDAERESNRQHAARMKAGNDEAKLVPDYYSEEQNE